MSDRVLGVQPAPWRRALLVAALTVAAFAAYAGYPDFRDTRLNDFANVVQPADAELIRSSLADLRNTIGIEAVVVTINSIRDYGTGDASIESFATNLFNSWGIGNSERNDGAMLLVAIKDRKVRIEVGSGFGSALDVPTKRIIDQTIVPYFKRGDYSAGIREGASALKKELGRWKPPAEADDPAVAVRASAQAPAPVAEDMGHSVDTTSQSAIIPPQRAIAPEHVHQVYPKPPVQTLHLPRQFGGGGSRLAVIIALATGGIGASIAGFALTRSNKCPNCKTKMELCDPSRDYERLNDGQELEEELKSVDYQFYRCPQCGHETMQKKRRFWSGYKQCPHCNYLTMQQEQQVISQPTKCSTGTRLIRRTCRHCSFHDEQQIMIPMLPQDTTFNSGGGNSSGSGSFGGSHSSGGGSFGGGHSSGGGSSGSW